MSSCEDCQDEFADYELRPWKYEPEVKLCDNCYEERLDDEQNQEENRIK